MHYIIHSSTVLFERRHDGHDWARTWWYSAVQLLPHLGVVVVVPGDTRFRVGCICEWGATSAGASSSFPLLETIMYFRVTFDDGYKLDITADNEARADERAEEISRSVSRPVKRVERVTDRTPCPATE